MQKYWTRFWHRRYGNCYTFNKGIDVNGTHVNVMNTSQPGFGNYCFFFSLWKLLSLMEFVSRQVLSISFQGSQS